MHHSLLPSVQPARTSIRYSSLQSLPSTCGSRITRPGPSAIGASTADMEPASSRTFAVFELLEHILLETCEEASEAPQLDLFILQRVSQSFKRTIENSPALQDRMLMRRAEEKEVLDWPTPVKWLSRMGLLPDLWVHSNKLLGPCLQFDDGTVRIDSRLGDFDEPEDLPSGDKMRAKLDYRSASWRKMKLPTRWNGRELLYCLPIASHLGGTEVTFWLRSSRNEVALGELYDQVKAIKEIGPAMGSSLASYCLTNVKKQALLFLRKCYRDAWSEHRCGQCMQFPECLFCRALYWADTLPLAVDWPLDGSRLTLPHKGAQVILDYLGYGPGVSVS